MQTNNSPSESSSTTSSVPLSWDVPVAPVSVQPQSLADLVQASLSDSQKTAVEVTSEGGIWVPGTTNANTGAGGSLPPKKPKKSLSPADAFRALAFLTLSITIFASVVLGYVVFHPEDAWFFNSLGIDPENIAQVLKQLISATFSITTLTLSIIAIICLYKFLSFKNPEQKKQKLLYGVGTMVVFVLLFGVLAAWATLFRQIGDVDFSNPNGGIILYDNDKYLDAVWKKASSYRSTIIDTTRPIIWPLTLRYDIKSNAKKFSQTMVIQWYEIDFDNSDGTRWRKTGNNPLKDDTIIATYTRPDTTYKPTGFYYGIDKITKKEIRKEMTLPTFKIEKVVEAQMKQEVMSLNADTLRSQGDITWSRDGVKIGDGAKYTAPIENTDYSICLAVIDNGKYPFAGGMCNKLIIIPGKDRAPITWELLIQPSEKGGLAYDLKVQDPKTKKWGEILVYEWLIDGVKKWEGKEYTYTFNQYGDYEVSLRMVDGNDESVTLSQTLNIKQPRLLRAGNNSQSLLDLRRASDDGSIQPNLLPFNYNRELGASVIRGITAGTRLSYNAEEVRIDGLPGESVTLKDVEVYFDEQRIANGISWEFLIPQSAKYNIYFKYLVETNRWEKDTIVQKIIIESSAQAMNPIMELHTSNNFAPVTLTVDASASNVRSGRIAKYLFDFGENKPPVDESKAVQTYIYDRPGEYSVVLTIVKDDGTKASIKRTIIVNTPPKNLSISRSLSSAQPEQSIDFSLSTVSNNIASYYWEFGDDISSQEEAPSHSYNKTGEYNVLLRVRYVDGTTATASTNVKIE